jgi:hypothetical protein
VRRNRSARSGVRQHVLLGDLPAGTGAGDARQIDALVRGDAPATGVALTPSPLPPAAQLAGADALSATAAPAPRLRTALTPRFRPPAPITPMTAVTGASSPAR